MREGVRCEKVAEFIMQQRCRERLNRQQCQTDQDGCGKNHPEAKCRTPADRFQSSFHSAGKTKPGLPAGCDQRHADDKGLKQEIMQGRLKH